MPFLLRAQQSFTGKVYDLEDRRVSIEGVTIRNLGNNQSTITRGGGQFNIVAKVGDSLEFSYVGYHTDTIYLINLFSRAVYLPPASTNLKEVSIRGVKLNSSILAPDPEAKEFKRIENDGLRYKGNTDKAGGFKFNLGYGKYKQQQERIKSMEEHDFYAKEINRVFTEKYVSDLVKLNGQELKDFMEMYRPTVVLVQRERPFNYDYYTAKAYSSWLKLPASQRKLPSVPRLKK